MVRASLIAAVLLCVSAPALAVGGEAADFQKGVDLMNPYLAIVGAPTKPPTSPDAQAKVHEGIRLLTQVTDANRDHWQALWFIGKGRQALKDHAAAEVAFLRAYAIDPAQPDVARELMIESICTGHTAMAVVVAERVAEAHPEDAGLTANLGLALLADTQVEKAEGVIERALQLAPSDRITQALQAEAKAVKGGRRPSRYCPP